MSDVVDVVVGADQVAAAAPDAVVSAEGGAGEKLPKRAVRNDDGTITLPLRMPVTLTVKRPSQGAQSETFDHLTFHAMTGADLAQISVVSDENRGAALVARSAQEPLAVVVAMFRKMDARDARDAQVCAGFFISDGE